MLEIIVNSCKSTSMGCVFEMAVVWLLKQREELHKFVCSFYLPLLMCLWYPPLCLGLQHQSCSQACTTTLCTHWAVHSPFCRVESGYVESDGNCSWWQFQTCWVAHCRLWWLSAYTHVMWREGYNLQSYTSCVRNQFDCSSHLCRWRHSLEDSSMWCDFLNGADSSSHPFAAACPVPARSNNQSSEMHDGCRVLKRGSLSQFSGYQEQGSIPSVVYYIVNWNSNSSTQNVMLLIRIICLACLGIKSFQASPHEER